MSNLNIVEKNPKSEIRNSNFETMINPEPRRAQGCPVPFSGTGQMFKMPTPTLILPLPLGGGGNRRGRETPTS